MNCEPPALAEAAKCFMCLPDGWIPPIKTRLMCEWANQPITPTGCSDPDTDAWVADIAASGATLPAPFQIEAVCRFCQYLKTYNIWDRMIYINPVIDNGDPASNLLAMSFPLLTPTGPDILNFYVNTDLTVNGLVANKDDVFSWVDTQISLAAVLPDNTSIGMSLYYFEQPFPLTLELDMGADDDPGGLGPRIDLTGAHIFLLPSASTFNCWDDAGSGVINSVPSSGFGFYSGNQTAVDFRELHHASSLTADLIVSLGIDIVDQSAFGPTVGNIYWHARNDSIGFAVFNSGKRLSFVAMHYGLDAAEVQLLYSGVQQLRQELGGGWI